MSTVCPDGLLVCHMKMRSSRGANDALKVLSSSFMALLPLGSSLLSVSLSTVPQGVMQSFEGHGVKLGLVLFTSHPSPRDEMCSKDRSRVVHRRMCYCYLFNLFILEIFVCTKVEGRGFPVVQWPRLHSPNVQGAPDSIPCQRTRPHTPQLRPGAAK